ncbi:MAG: polysaccharide biosynthesis C-terminal domain-containing protein [Eubacteriales bacterium]
MSRTKNSMINIAVSLFSKSFSYFITFVYRTVFICTLSAEYLGINGLFTNILSVLSLAELGVGTAIVYSLYQPIASGDSEKIKSFMQLYRRLYTAIGIFIMALGLCLTPFLSVFVNDMPDIPNIELIYVLYVINFSVSYFVLYGQTIIAAHQKSYINSLYKQSVVFVMTILQCVLLICFHNYLGTLVLQLTSTLVSGGLLIAKARKLFPYLEDKDIAPIEINEKRTIKKNIFAMLHHHLGTVIVLCTDNLLISKFVGVVAVGLYSNYVLITSGLASILATIISSITASVGNLGTSENKGHQLEVFYDIFFLFSICLGMITVCLAVLLQPFIALWIGESYMMSTEIVIMIVVNFYLLAMRKPALMCHDTYGLFWYDRYKPIVEAMINLGASLILAPKFGVIGVLLGTAISTITVCLWVEPFVLYKYVYECSVWKYFRRYAKYTLCMLVVMAVTFRITGGFTGTVVAVFLKKLGVCVVVVPVSYWVLMHRWKEWRRLDVRLSNCGCRTLWCCIRSRS